MVAIKVCGITRAEDGRLAWELGAAALGFVFHAASPRGVTAKEVARIRRELPEDAVCIGVFVDRCAEEIRDVAAEVRLSAVQLHGRETPELAAQIELPVIKALRAEEVDGVRLREYRVAAFLLDASHPTLAGGTGLCADWELARKLAVHQPLILAGGLNPGNARKAFEVVRPRGLDLSSGLEIAPGRKDPARMRGLFTQFPQIGVRPCLF